MQENQRASSWNCQLPLGGYNTAALLENLSPPFLWLSLCISFLDVEIPSSQRSGTHDYEYTIRLISFNLKFFAAVFLPQVTSLGSTIPFPLKNLCSWSFIRLKKGIFFHLRFFRKKTICLWSLKSIELVITNLQHKGHRMSLKKHQWKWFDFLNNSLHSSSKVKSKIYENSVLINIPHADIKKKGLWKKYITNQRH